MSETLKISGGSNHYDPVRDVISQRIGPTSQPGEAFAGRCHEVYGETLGLLSRLDGISTKVGQYNVTLTSPPIRYETSEQQIGLVWLQSTLRRPSDSRLTFDAPPSRIGLLAGVKPDILQARKVMSLSPTDLLYAGDIYFKSGNHPELNFFQGVITKIRENTFPKDKQQERTRRLDLEADAERRLENSSF